MKSKNSYECSSCGYKSVKWLGKCPNCGEWNCFEEVEGNSLKKGYEKKLSTVSKVEVSKLIDIESTKNHRLITNINEFDRVMGGGVVKDSVTILTSPPGGGKSTLVLAVANNAAKQGYKVLYASGEESESQIKTRADRILKKINGNIWLVSDTCLNNVINSVNSIDPDIIIIDSIQTFYLEEYLPSRAGNPTQTMECAGELVGCAKSKERPRAVILIGQMNKNDELAGLRSLEHLVDTVLIMDGDSDNELRSIIATKNRFGSTGEMGFFSMTEEGLVSIDNPSEFFITKRENGEEVSGSALTVIREGSRPIIAEIESLVSNSFTPYPSRICEALKREQLNTLISIIEQRCGINLFNKNVVLKTTGGIKLREQSSNLAIIMSIISSVLNKPIPSDTAFISDVGLTGELKKVPSLDSRLRELARMGFKRVFVSKDGLKDYKFDGIKVIGHRKINDIINSIFYDNN